MNEQLIAMGLGFVLGAAAKRLVRWWTESAPKIQATLDSVDDKLFAKLDIAEPESVQETWHNLVHGAVAYANKFASDGRFWREVIRAVVTRDPAKAVLLMTELQQVSWDSGIAAVEATISPELKAVVNEVKEAVALNVAAANAVTVGISKPEPEVRAAIRLVAPAHKTVEGPVTKDAIKRLIEESQARQAKLGGAK